MSRLLCSSRRGGSFGRRLYRRRLHRGRSFRSGSSLNHRRDLGHRLRFSNRLHRCLRLRLGLLNLLLKLHDLLDHLADFLRRRQGRIGFDRELLLRNLLRLLQPLLQRCPLIFRQRGGWVI